MRLIFAPFWSASKIDPTPSIQQGRQDTPYSTLETLPASAGCFQPVWRKGSLDVAIGSDRFVRAVTCFSALELINVLSNQITFDLVASDER
jgi:hypothetical protein